MNKHTSSTSSSPSRSSDPAAAGSIADSVHSLVDQGAETVGAIKARVSEVTDDARTQGAAVLERTTALVKKYPLRSLAIAFGIGYAAMRITTSKVASLAMLGGLVYTTSRLLGPSRSPRA